MVICNLNYNPNLNSVLRDWVGCHLAGSWWIGWCVCFVLEMCIYPAVGRWSLGLILLILPVTISKFSFDQWKDEYHSAVRISLSLSMGCFVIHCFPSSCSFIFSKFSSTIYIAYLIRTPILFLSLVLSVIMSSVKFSQWFFSGTFLFMVTVLESFAISRVAGHRPLLRWKPWCFLHVLVDLQPTKWGVDLWLCESSQVASDSLLNLSALGVLMREIRLAMRWPTSSEANVPYLEELLDRS